MAHTALELQFFSLHTALKLQNELAPAFSMPQDTVHIPHCAIRNHGPKHTLTCWHYTRKYGSVPYHWTGLNNFFVPFPLFSHYWAPRVDRSSNHLLQVWPSSISILSPSSSSGWPRAISAPSSDLPWAPPNLWSPCRGQTHYYTDFISSGWNWFSQAGNLFASVERHALIAFNADGLTARLG